MIVVDSGIFFLQITGDLDLDGVENLQVELAQGLDAYGEWEQLSVDLFNAHSICSAGVLFISDLFQQVEALGKGFMVIGCNDEILRRMKLFRLHTQFPIGINKSSAELAEEQKQRDSRKTRVEQHVNVPRPGGWTTNELVA